MPQSADERIERIPVGAAKVFEGIVSRRHTGRAGSQHHTPVRGRKLAVNRVHAIGRRHKAFIVPKQRMVSSQAVSALNPEMEEPWEWQVRAALPDRGTSRPAAATSGLR